MRYASIDILRSFAIVLMIVVHFMENLSGSTWAPAGFGAPLFTFLVGVSYRIWLNSQEAKGQKSEEISRVSIRRGLFLFALGFAFNILVWLPEDTFNWDVLTFIGTALIVLNGVRRLPSVVPVMMGVWAFVLAPILRQMADYPSYWIDGYFDPDWTLTDVCIGFTVTGYFPLIPWLLYPLSGYVTATALFQASPDTKPRLLRIGLIGLACIALAIVVSVIRRYYPERMHPVYGNGWTMFPASVEYTAGTLGIALLLFALLHEWVDRRQIFSSYQRFLGFTGTLSKYSLSIYLLHHILHLWPLWITTLSLGHDDPTDLWRLAIPTAWSIPLSISCILVCYGIFRWIDRTKRTSVESWMRWLCG